MPGGWRNGSALVFGLQIHQRLWVRAPCCSLFCVLGLRGSVGAECCFAGVQTIEGECGESWWGFGVRWSGGSEKPRVARRTSHRVGAGSCVRQSRRRPLSLSARRPRHTMPPNLPAPQPLTGIRSRQAHRQRTGARVQSNMIHLRILKLRAGYCF